MIGLGFSFWSGSRLRALVRRDVEAYRALIASKGGTLGDESISEAEAVARLTAFVTALYALVGRCDFWALQTAYQAAVDSKCYSFHGLEGTLVNGPTWSAEGVVCGATDRYVELSVEPSPAPYWMAYSGRVDEYTGNDYIISINNGVGYSHLEFVAISSDQLLSGIRTEDGPAYSAPPWRSPYTVGDFFFAATGYAAGAHLVRVDGNAYSRDVVSTATLGSRLRLNIRPDTGAQGGRTTPRFAMVNNSEPSASLFASLQSIYNSTLGVVG